jgi:hypothetical protein
MRDPLGRGDGEGVLVIGEKKGYKESGGKDFIPYMIFFLLGKG